MKTQLFSDALAALPTAQLTAFVKDNDLTITGYGKLKSGDKRDAVLNLLKASEDLRAAFVAHFTTVSDDKSYSDDPNDWDAEGAPADDDDADDETAETVEDAEVVSETPAPAKTTGTDVSTVITQVPTFVDSALETMMADVIELNAQDSTSALRAAQDAAELSDMQIGVLLLHVKEQQHYASMGYANMREYMDGELSLDYRKGMYLAGNAQTIRDLGIPASALEGVTWSALRIVAPQLTTTNYKTWLKAARDLTHAKLRSKVDKAKLKAADAKAVASGNADENGKDASPEVSTMTHTVTVDQKETINQALAKAKVDGNVDSAGAAMDVMAAAYLGSPTSPTTAKEAAGADTSHDALVSLFTKMKTDSGYEGAVAILQAVEAVYPDVDLSAEFPEDGSAAVAAQ